MKLINPLALVRWCSGVMSGISATVGDRYRLMARFISIMNSRRVNSPLWNGISMVSTAASGIPIIK
ncbi:hypothetical protein D3C85_1218290 [compost metagenome]